MSILDIYLNSGIFPKKAPTEPSNKAVGVSARQELKRRGSWPVAYSNKVFYKYEQK